MRVLVTGGAGFIGSHFVEHALVETDWELVVLDSLTYASQLYPLMGSAHLDWDRVRFVWHDLRAPLEPLSGQLDQIQAVFHFASGSHVDRSIEDPVPFIQNNVMGTTNLLEWARGQSQLTHFFMVSTDEVYGAVPDGVYSREWDPIIPSNPYAASKAAQEAVAIAYWRTYGVPVVITNTMNNVGERQHAEKFIPMVIRRLTAAEPEPIEIHGTLEPAPGGERFHSGSRHWLHARNHADALLFLTNVEPAQYRDFARRGMDYPKPDRWNVAGEEMTNWDMAVLLKELVEDQLGYQIDLDLIPVDFHRARPGHDPRYALDGTKLRAAGWKPPLTLKESLKHTVAWYIAQWQAVIPSR